MPPSDRSSEIGQHFPVRFDPDPWEDDLARSTPAGRTAARDARRNYERDGAPISHLKPCEAEGRDGTSLTSNDTRSVSHIAVPSHREHHRRP